MDRSLRGQALLAVVVVLGAISCSRIDDGVGAGATDQLPASSTLAGDAAGLPASVTPLPIDTPTSGCMGGTDTRLAVLQIHDGPGFYSLFPGAGEAPELSRLSIPTTVVVYRNGWPGPVLSVPGSDSGKRAPDPGTWDVCLEAPDNALGLPFVVYANIAQAGSPITHP